eukprot:1717395-Alexandrium_andersonii.AAC.1
MSASLVGSEMCIRDRLRRLLGQTVGFVVALSARVRGELAIAQAAHAHTCLLYTSDAADDM